MPSCNWLIPMAKVEAKECGALVWGWRVCANERGRSEVETNAIKASACGANEQGTIGCECGADARVGQTSEKREWGKHVQGKHACDKQAKCGANDYECGADACGADDIGARMWCSAWHTQSCIELFTVAHVELHCATWSRFAIGCSVRRVCRMQ
jgi:hypothetical protein